MTHSTPCLVCHSDLCSFQSNHLTPPHSNAYINPTPPHLTSFNTAHFLTTLPRQQQQSNRTDPVTTPPPSQDHRPCSSYDKTIATAASLMLVRGLADELLPSEARAESTPRQLAPSVGRNERWNHGRTGSIDSEDQRLHQGANPARLPRVRQPPAGSSLGVR